MRQQALALAPRLLRLALPLLLRSEQRIEDTRAARQLSGAERVCHGEAVPGGALELGLHLDPLHMRPPVASKLVHALERQRGARGRGRRRRGEVVAHRSLEQPLHRPQVAEALRWLQRHHGTPDGASVERRDQLGRQHEFGVALGSRANEQLGTDWHEPDREAGGGVRALRSGRVQHLLPLPQWGGRRGGLERGRDGEKRAPPMRRAASFRLGVCERQAGARAQLRHECTHRDLNQSPPALAKPLIAQLEQFGQLLALGARTQVANLVGDRAFERLLCLLLVRVCRGRERREAEGRLDLCDLLKRQATHCAALYARSAEPAGLPVDVGDGEAATRWRRHQRGGARSLRPVLLRVLSPKLQRGILCRRRRERQKRSAAGRSGAGSRRGAATDARARRRGPSSAGARARAAGIDAGGPWPRLLRLHRATRSRSLRRRLRP